jgi:hypothetical protein
MTDPRLRLATAFLRMVREARKPEPDAQAGADFGNALFDCPDGFDTVAELLPTLCSEDELRDVLEAADMMRSATRPH